MRGARRDSDPRMRPFEARHLRTNETDQLYVEWNRDLVEGFPQRHMYGGENHFERRREERHRELLTTRHLSEEVGLAVEHRTYGFLAHRRRHDCLKVPAKGFIAGGSQVGHSAFARLWRPLSEFNFRCVAAKIPQKKAGSLSDIGDAVNSRVFGGRRKQRSISFEDGTVREQYPAGRG